MHAAFSTPWINSNSEGIAIGNLARHKYRSKQGKIHTLPALYVGSAEAKQRTKNQRSVCKEADLQ